MIHRKKISNTFRGNIIEFRKEIKNGLLALWNNENNGDNMNSKLTITIKGTTVIKQKEMGNNRFNVGTDAKDEKYAFNYKGRQN